MSYRYKFECPPEDFISNMRELVYKSQGNVSKYTFLIFILDHLPEDTRQSNFHERADKSLEDVNEILLLYYYESTATYEKEAKEKAKMEKRFEKSRTN